MRTSSSLNSCAYILSDHSHPGLRVFSVQCQQACLSGADIDFVKGRFELACMTIIGHATPTFGVFKTIHCKRQSAIYSRAEGGF